ncbi:MAG TPA: hypothetical protein VMK12_25275 [Anaeromyxobacteraceae bacterium]|nr:hypothetical protein [Anaeromyxobacteraceae bacterium]
MHALERERDVAEYPQCIGRALSKGGLSTFNGDEPQVGREAVTPFRQLREPGGVLDPTHAAAPLVITLAPERC